VSLARTLRDELGPIGPDRDRDTPVAAGPVGGGDIAQGRDELGVVVGVGGVVARVACRAHAGCAVEGIDLDPRVVGDRRKPGGPGNGSRFGEGVGGELVERLFENEVWRDVVKRDQLNVSQQGRDLFGLVPVARREDGFQPARAFSWCSRSSRMPFSAMSIRVSSSARANTPFSAVP
jgi:hypothetical protein